MEVTSHTHTHDVYTIYIHYCMHSSYEIKESTNENLPYENSLSAGGDLNGRKSKEREYMCV